MPGPHLADRAEDLDQLAGGKDPLQGDDDGTGWPLGGTVRFADLFRIVFGVEGVATVDDLRIVIDGERKAPCENAEIPKGYLVYSDGHDISVSQERTDG